MPFLWTTLNVTNLDASIHFYETVLQLPLQRRFHAGPDTEIAFLGSGETKIELISTPYIRGFSAVNGISIGFSVTSLEDMQSVLSNENTAILEGPYSPNPQMTFLFLQDPDGFRIQLVEQHELQV